MNVAITSTHAVSWYCQLDHYGQTSVEFEKKITQKYAFENDDCKIYWLNMLRRIYVKFSVLWLGISHFLVSKNQPTPTQWHFGVSRTHIERMLVTYGGLEYYCYYWWICPNMQDKQQSAFSAEAICTHFRCFAHLLRGRTEFMAIRDGGN